MGDVVDSKKKASTRVSSKESSRGAWRAEEDRKLAEAIAVHGPKRWKTLAAQAAPRSVSSGVEMATQLAEGKEGAMGDRSTAGVAATTTSHRGGDSLPKPSNQSFDDNAADDDFFDFSNESPMNLEWVTRFLEFDEHGHKP
ncbi:hypothetical protein SAY86_017086 [Trapa natans]|uniref:Uncharacterized protein n=1 Tax=Trapa natans TaxID=22666 RepID=A0AAN7R4T5_TRANT|nr:hypothetical protein SAY86_017086 [Trapa natans]